MCIGGKLSLAAAFSLTESSGLVGAVRAPNAARRRAAESLGRDAEAAVAQIWQAKGYDVLARRMRTGAGEIDLVVANSESLVFVEVKARKSLAEAAYAVSPRQQARLWESAGMALAMNPDWAREATRFDVALVCGGVVEHVEDAIRYH
jgi:putative endonuclease